MIASHYAEPAERVIATSTALRAAPADEADAIRNLAPGEPFALLDDTLGWSWGYGGQERRVGYVRSDTLDR